MENTNFMTLSQDECRVVYKLILQNAKSKFEEAELLANNGRYNTASSLLIISNEESLKAMILFFDSIGFRIRSISGMKSLFNNHKLRYLLAMVISILSIFMKEVFAFILKTVQNPGNLKFLISRSDDFESMAKDFLTKKLVEVRNEILFFSKVDKARQQGFYSDYKNGLIVVTELEYIELNTKITALNSMISMAIDTYQDVIDGNDKIMKDHLIDLKKQLHGELKGKISDLIKRINKPDVNSYDDLLEVIDDLNDSLKEPFGEIGVDKKEKFKLLINAISDKE